MRPVGSKISIILATYNEQEHIVETIASIYEQIPPPLEMIVVDDSSPDGTAALVKSLNFSNLVVIERKKKGLASAFHRGILESTGDIVCWLDADMCMPATVLKEMIDHLDVFDIVIGSRYAQGGSDNRSYLRVLSSRAINGFARMVLGGDVKDYDSGFVALNRDVFNSVTLIPFGYGEYFIEMIYDAHRAGLKIYELGYTFTDRAKGVSKSAPSLWKFFKTGLHYVFRILSLKLRFLRGGN
jgi:dolichol-phosphate mannosyltransferase